MVFTLSFDDRKKIQDLIEERTDFAAAFKMLQDEQIQTLRKLSHELNNALTLISSSLQLMESNHPEVRSFKYWGATMGDIDYMKTLLTDLLDYNKDNHLVISDIDLSFLLQEVVMSFSSIKNDKNIKLVTAIPENLPSIQGDSIKLKQAIINLIKNSYEAIGQGGIIRLTLKRSTTGVHLIVSDDGCGMTKEQMESIFLPMVTFKTNGTGLGLSITEKIIAAHKGTIKVNSKVNVGTTFTIFLPFY